MTDTRALLQSLFAVTAAAQRIDTRKQQNNNDSYRFFEKTGNLIMTVPTRTNVNDFRAILVG